MKTILIIYFFIITLNSIGQGYIKSIKKDNKWNILIGAEAVEKDSTLGYRTHSLTIGNDSVVSDTLYNMLISTKYTYYDTTDYFVGLIREDTIEEKVYFRKPNQKDRLIYDFSLNDDDTIKNYICNLGKCYDAVIINTDSVNINDKVRKVQYIQVIDWYKDTVIEGIGSVRYGLVNLSHIDAGPKPYGFLCFWEDETLVYFKSNPFFGCMYYSIPNTIENKRYKPNQTIWFNQNSNVLTIKSSGLIKYFSLYDIYGRNIMKSKPYNHNIEINIGNLITGYYIIQMNSENKKLFIE